MNNSVIGVSLKFNADVSQAKTQMQSLQNQLTQIMNFTTMSNGIGSALTADLNQASIAAAQLKSSLSAAFNQKTGKLDLGNFQRALKQSGTNLTQLQARLASIGPAGTQAFSQVALQVASASTSMVHLNTLTMQLMKSLWSVAKYHLSSGIVMGLVSGLSNAVGFAKELNTSLNNIRIVTNLSAEEMDRFAAKANKAAKALHTTTTAFTDASLIYFQQGLSMEEAQRRAEITIKMANVTGQAVETVSDQLTAVWNNFEDGTQSLEYYVDVLTALGAATASSTDEIAQGLEKFAAVAQTVGLSYEYATAALATVTATTRQSADVVGTAFKTLFARIQDLDLGETLEDGTTLGSYSQALMAVGINIKDINGELKGMDTILNEMGAKWNTLSNDQQVALAKSVAGIRQYTQLIALMDNWDFMQENLDTAYNSTGTLQEQADIYAESWEAAQKKVTASLESIWQNLLDDDTFIAVFDTLSEIIDKVGVFIDSLGGMKGILLLVSSLLMKTFSTQLAGMISSAGTKISDLNIRFTNLFRNKDNQKMTSTEAFRASAESAVMNATPKTTGAQMELDMTKQQLQLTRELAEKKQQLSGVEADTLTILEQQTQQAYEQASAATQSLDAAGAEASAQLYQAGINAPGQKEQLQNYAEAVSQNAATESLSNRILAGTSRLAPEAQAQEISDQLDNMGFTADDAAASLEKLYGPGVKSAFADLAKAASDYAKALKEVNAAGDKATDEQKAKLKSAKTEYDSKRDNAQHAVKESQTRIGKARGAVSKDAQHLVAEESALTQAYQQSGQAADAAAQATGNYQNKVNTSKQAVEGLGVTTITLSQRFMSFATAVSQVGMVISSVQGIVDTWSNPDMSGWDRAVSVLTGLAITIPMVTMALNAKNVAALFGIKLDKAQALGQMLVTKWGWAEASARWAVVAAYTVYIALIAGAVIGIAALCGAFSDQESASEKAAKGQKAANESAQQATEAYNKATEAVNEFNEALQSLQDQKDAMATMATNTDEYREALEKVNEEMMELIRKYDLWDKYIVDSRGVIQINEDALEEIRTQYEKAALNSEFYSIAQQDNAAKARYKAKIAPYKDKWADKESDSIGDDYYSIDNKSEGNEILINADKTPMTKTMTQILEDYHKDTLELSEKMENTLLHFDEAGEAEKRELLDVLEKKGYFKLGSRSASLSYMDFNSSSGKLFINTLTTIADSYQDQIDALDANTKAMVAFASDNALGELYTELATKNGQVDDGAISLYSKMGTTLAENNGDIINTINAISDQFAQAWSGVTDKVKNTEKWINEDFQASVENYGLHFEDSEGNEITTSYGLLKHLYGDNVATQGVAFSSNMSIDDYARIYAADQGWGEVQVDSSEKGKLVIKDMQGNTLFDASNTQIMQGVNAIVQREVQAAALAPKYEEIGADVSTIVSGTAQSSNAYGVDWGSQFMQAVANKEFNASELLGGLNETEYNELKNLLVSGDTEALMTSLFGPQYQELLAAGKLTTDEVKGMLQNALGASWNEDAYKAGADQAGLQQASLAGLDEEEFTKYRDGLAEVNEELAKNRTLLNEVAVANMKAQRGIEALSSQDAWIKSLESGAEGSVKYITALQGLQSAFSDLLGIDASQFGADFFTKNKELIAQAENGNSEAIEELRQISAQTLMFDDADLYAQRDKITNFIDQMQADTKLTIGTTLDTSTAMQGLSDLLISCGTTVTEIQDQFNSLGWTPQFEEITVPAGTTISSAGYVTMEDGTSYYVGTGIDTSADITVPAIKATGQKGKTVDAKKDIKATYRGKAKETIDSSKAQAKAKDAEKKKKKLKDEVERYHELKELMSDLEREYDNVSKAADRAFGQSKLDLLDQQIAKQHELIDAQKEYMAQIDANLAKDQKALAAYGARFDKSGRITNYDELVAAMVAQANARNTDESDEAYENFKEALSQYEETLNLSEEQRAALQDMLWEEIDLKIEKVSAEVEFKVSIDEDSFQWIEYQLGKLGDDAIDAAQKLKLLTDNLAITTQQMETYQQGIKDTLSASGFSDEEIAQVLAGGDLNALMEGKELTADQVEQLREYRDGLYDAMEAAEEYRDQVVESLTDAFEDLNNEMDKHSSKLQHYTDMVQGYRDIVDLVGPDLLGISDEMLREMNQTKVTLSTNSISAAKTILDTRKRELEAAQKALAEAQASGQQETIDIWQEQVDTITESVQEAESDLQSAWQEGLQTATDVFADNITLIQKKFEEAMSGIFGSFEAMQTAFDQAKEISELYLDDYQKIYELSKLNRDLNKSIDSTDNLQAKSKLRDLQEEINALQESNTEMSQYEVDKLRAKYDLRLAEIALEEAQNAKSQVRMRRDSEGNWGYVYTADANAVAQAEQNYEDKLYAYQQKIQQFMQTAQEQLMTIPSQMSEALAEIMQDITLTEEQRQKKIAETKKHYETLYKYWTQQLNQTTRDAKEIYETDWANYSQITGYKVSADQDWADSWSETVYAQITGFGSMEEAQSNFLSATDEMLTALEEAWNEWYSQVDAACQAAGISIEDFSTSAKTYLDNATREAEETRVALQNIGTTGATAFEALATSASSWLSSYATSMETYRKEAETVIAALNNLIIQAGKAGAAMGNITDPDYSGGKENFDLQVDPDTDPDTDPEDPAPQSTSIGGYSAINRTMQQTPQGETIYHLAYGEVDRSFDPAKDIASGLWYSQSKGWYAQLTSGKRAYLNLQDFDTRTFIQDYMRNHTAVIQGKDMERVAGADNEILQFYPNKPENLKNSYLVYTTQKDGHVTHLLRRRNDSSSNATIMELTSADAREYIQRFDLMHSGLQLFNTGGYTGSWDSSGRLAMLHQKEIVLNAHDTENFLAGIEILREITQAIDLQALSLARTPTMQVSQSLGSQDRTTLQGITVYAEFPHATDRNEIQEALLSLPNYASQFANRKN